MVASLFHFFKKLREIHPTFLVQNFLFLGKIIGLSIVVLIVSVLISAVGGFYVGGLLSESKYILKLDVFRGVKLSFLLPICFFAFAYVIKCGVYCDEKGEPLLERDFEG